MSVNKEDKKNLFVLCTTCTISPMRYRRVNHVKIIVSETNNGKTLNNTLRVTRVLLHRMLIEYLVINLSVQEMASIPIVEPSGMSSV